MADGRQPLRLACVNAPAGRRQQHHRIRRAAPRANRRERREERLGLHHHARPAAERHIVHDVMLVGREVAQVVDDDVQQPAVPAPGRPRLRSRPASTIRGKIVMTSNFTRHSPFSSSSPSGGRTVMRFAGRSTVQISSASGISTSFRVRRIHHQAARPVAVDRGDLADRLAARRHHRAANQIAVVVLDRPSSSCSLGLGDPQLRSGQAAPRRSSTRCP